MILHILIPAIIIVAIAVHVFSIQSHRKNDSLTYSIVAPELKLTNPTALLQAGSCRVDEDCVYPSLHCLGNTCVVRPDVPPTEVCNESHGCYSVLTGISNLGIVTNSCVPFKSQLWDRDNCNGANPFNCRGVLDELGVCTPSYGSSIVKYMSYGGAQELITTLDTRVAKLFCDANKGILSII